MSLRLVLHALFAVLCLLTIGVSPLLAEPIGPDIDPEGLGFTQVSAPATLRIEGPDGYRYEAIFEPGETPRFQANSELVDGIYKYELRVNGSEGHVAVEGNGSRTLSGQVALVDGQIQIPQWEEPLSTLAPADVVHADDVIVDGYLCVGTHCADGESFGNDKLRIKDFVLRVNFQDVSTGNLPSGDWRFIFNDTLSNGANYFAIEDVDTGRIPFRLDAFAPPNSLYIDSAGEVGFGTSLPEANLHIADGDSPTILLDKSAGFFPSQKWSMDGSPFGFSISDITNNKTPFRIEPNASVFSLFVESTSDVGVGTSSPTASLHVRRTDGSARLFIEEANGSAGERTLGLFANKGALNLQLDNTDVDRQWLVGVRSGGDFRIQSNQAAGGVINFLMNLDGALTLSGNLTVGSCSGCTAVRAAESASVDLLSDLAAIPIRRWRTRDAVEHLAPDMAAFHALTGLGQSADGIAPLDVATLALAGVQSHEEEIAALRAENAELRARLAAIEAALGVESSQELFLPSAGR